MAIYGLVFDGFIVETQAAPFDVPPTLAWTQDLSALTPQPAIGWSAGESAGVWTFAAPPAPVIDLTLPNKDQAQALLAASDVTMSRCTESGVAVPAEWKAYRGALRAIRASGALPAAGWPAKPAYPAGT